MIDFHNLEFHCFTNVGIIVADRFDINLRSREKRFNAKNIYDHTAFGAALDISLDYLIIVKRSIYPVPGFQCTCFLM